MVDRLGPEVRRRGLAATASMREILRLHRPEDGPPVPRRAPKRYTVLDREGRLLQLDNTHTEMAMAATGTDDPGRLPYKD